MSLREDYIQGKLSAAESEEFENGLSQQDRRELAVELGQKEAINEFQLDEIRRRVKGFDANTGKNKTRIIWPWAIAASLVLFTTIAWLYNTTNESLMDEFYEGYANYEYTVTRGEEGVDNDTRVNAYLSYDNADFDLAIELFDEFLTTNPNAIPERFFRAISHIEIGSMDAALKDLAVVMNSESDYRVPAIWYAALLLVEENQEEKARELLDSLAGTRYEPKADSLRKRL